MEFLRNKSQSFSGLNPITQVYWICFDKHGKILITKEHWKPWNIPWGTPEQWEVPVQTLKRELKEEADIEISRNQMIGYIKVLLDDNSTIYQLRFACIIEKIEKQTIDPANNRINKRKFVSNREFFDYVEIEDYRPMIDEAIKWFEANK